MRIGADVKSGDILVGKVTPKGETQLTPEEKLLRAIFGEKAGDVRHLAPRCPPALRASSSAPRSSAAKGVEKDERAQDIEEQASEGSDQPDRDERSRFDPSDSAYRQLKEMLDRKAGGKSSDDDEAVRTSSLEGRHSRPTPRRSIRAVRAHHHRGW